ncbi:MAG: hypothetical protein GY733_17855 [bacterium]|nr:hypothetical protein [bacterium]
MRPQRFLDLLLILALGVALACGVSAGGSGDQMANGGIGGTGVSEGPITDFGSIFVNNIEWFLDDAEIEFDDEDGSEDDLRIGMVVRVEGDIDKDNRTGRAARVHFDDELEGPIESIAPVGSDGLIKELVVLGQRVWVEDGRTRFDDDDASVFGFDTIAVDDVVEVSGLLDADGVLRATHVEFEGTIDLGNTEVELQGTISGFSAGSTFMIGGVTVTFDPTGAQTDLSDLPGGVTNGITVEVDGVITAPNQVFAEEIEAEDGSDDEDIEEFSISGFISNFVDASDFEVSGRAVDASAADFDHGDVSMLEDGVQVEVDGDWVDGVLVAEQVEFEEED